MLDRLFSKRREPQYSSYNVISDHIRLSFHFCVAVPSTPAAAADVGEGAEDDRSLGVSIIEPSVPAPILVSDASIEEFQRCLPKPTAASEPPPSPRAFSPRAASPHAASPRTASPRAAVSPAVRESTHSDVEELYFNNWVKSNQSDLGKPDPHQELKHNFEVWKKNCGHQRKDDRRPAVHSVPLCKIVQESGGGSSGVEAGGGGWDADARAHYYHNKLLSTMQVLQNREETVRVQSESLRVAEARIADLTARAARLRAQLERKAEQVRSLRVADESRPARAEAAATETQELKQQKAVVRSLQTNLSIIEDLYRECFYETVKQDELIEKLRDSYLEDRIAPQDIATDVDILKLDLTNLSNNSNNDSGVWERAEGEAEWGEQLRDISQQLERLRTMLDVDCTCGLEEENMRLKNTNESLEIQLGEVRQRVSELEAIQKEIEETEQYKREIEEKSKQLHSIKEQMAQLEEKLEEKNTACETFSRQLQQSQASLADQSGQLSEARRRASALEDNVRQLTEELRRANQRADESRDLREELSARASVAEEDSRRVRALKEELARARAHCRHLDRTYREQAVAALSLQAQLEEAQSRGARLCNEVRDSVNAVRDWLRRHRGREDKIKEQECIIKSLQHRLELRQKDDNITVKDDLCCPRCVSIRRNRCREFKSETASCSKCLSNVEGRHNTCSGTSGSERASPSSVPTPPQRLLRKNNFQCAVAECGGSVRRDAQRPHRRDSAPARCTHHFTTCDISSVSELEQRMRALQEALDHSTTRWPHAR